MPENIMADTPELGGNDTSDYSLTSSSSLSTKTNPSCGIRSRANTYNDDDSDSHSDDDSTSSSESGDAVSSKLDDSDSLEKSNITPSLQLLSLAPKTSPNTAESRLSERGDYEVWTRSSSESSHLPASDEEDFSEDDLSEEDLSEENLSEENLGEENGLNSLSDVLRTLNLFEQEDKSNDETNNEVLANSTSQDDDYVDNKTCCPLNIPVSSEKKNTSSDNESGYKKIEFCARGADRTSKNHHESRPYGTVSPRNTGQQITPESIYNDYLEQINGAIDCLNRESSLSNGFLTTPQLNFNCGLNVPIINTSHESLAGSSEAWSTVAQPLSSGSSSIVSDNEPTLSPITPQPDFASRFILPTINTSFDSPAGSPQVWSEVQQPWSAASFSSLSDDNEPLSPIPPPPDFDDLELAAMNASHESPAGSPQMCFLTVQPPLSSGSSSSVSDNNERSPQNYDSGVDSHIEDNISTDFQDLRAFEVHHVNRLNDFVSFGNLDSQQDASGTQLYETLINEDYSTDDYSNSFPDMLLDMPTNIGQANSSGCPDTQTETQIGMSLNQITEAPFTLYTATPTQNQNNFGFTNTVQFNRPATQIQNATRDSTAGGTLIVTSNNQGNRDDVRIQNNKSENYDLGQIRNATLNVNHQMNCVSNIPPETLSTSATTPLIPRSVEVFLKQSSPRSRHPRVIAPWPLLDHSSTPASERLEQNVDPGQLQKTMNYMYDFALYQYAEQKNGDTPLMAILRDHKRVKSFLAKIRIMLDKMARIPESFTMRNSDGSDALYLAAINCPEFNYVAGALVAAMTKASVDRNIWQRKYGTKGDTLIHAVAAKGETHKAMLQELVATGKFDLSAQNVEDETPLHIAVEAHNVARGVNSVAIIQILMKFGANSIIKNRNGETPLHMALSKTHCLGLVQALLCNDSGCAAINIPNNAGNTPVHLAVALLNNAHQGTQEEICYRLIINGGQSNVLNRQNKAPLGLVANNRHEILGKILHKK